MNVTQEIEKVERDREQRQRTHRRELAGRFIVCKRQHDPAAHGSTLETLIDEAMGMDAEQLESAVEAADLVNRLASEAPGEDEVAAALDASGEAHAALERFQRESFDQERKLAALASDASSKYATICAHRNGALARIETIKARHPALFGTNDAPAAPAPGGMTMTGELPMVDPATRRLGPAIEGRRSTLLA